MLKRIKIVGTSGSGKTTLARQIADKLNSHHIELDALHWDENWINPPDDEFRNRVASAMQTGESWVMDGNYSKVSELTFQSADTVVWLDYSLSLIYWRIITRTLKRVFLREKLWNENRESIRISFFSKESVIWWAISTYHRRKRQYTEMIKSNQYPHITFIRLTSPQQTNNWLKGLSVD